MKVAYFAPLLKEIEVCDDCMYEDQVAPGWVKMLRSTDREPMGDLCQVPGCGAYKDARPGDITYQKHLYTLSEAVGEVSSAQGAADTAIASAKLAGKTLANVGVMGMKLGLKMLKMAPTLLDRQIEANEKLAREVLARDDLSEEDQHKFTSILARCKEMKERRRQQSKGNS